MRCFHRGPLLGAAHWRSLWGQPCDPEEPGALHIHRPNLRLEITCSTNWLALRPCLEHSPRTEECGKVLGLAFTCNRWVVVAWGVFGEWQSRCSQWLMMVFRGRGLRMIGSRVWIGSEQVQRHSPRKTGLEAPPMWRTVHGDLVGVVRGSFLDHNSLACDIQERILRLNTKNVSCPSSSWTCRCLGCLRNRPLPPGNSVSSPSKQGVFRTFLSEQTPQKSGLTPQALPLGA